MTNTDWEALYADEVVSTPVDTDVVELASRLEPGSALDLGCGTGQNSLWLAKHGWSVTGVDIAPTAISHAQQAAHLAGLTVVFEVGDITEWQTDAVFDLVVSTYAMPPRGVGRDSAIATAVTAVAPAGYLLLAEFDESLAEGGWWKRRDLVALHEIAPHLETLEIVTAEVTTKAHSHGHDEEHYPVAFVVARRPG